MDLTRLNKWIGDINGLLYPLGTNIDVVESLKFKNRIACTIALVHCHRFAFYFWAKFNKEYKEKGFTPKYSSPILVSIDFHDDTGTEDDFDKDEIKELNVDDEVELGLFCWLRLHPLNDGHILPALYLNYFSDTYILLKQKYDNQKSEQIIDLVNREHSIKYFTDTNKLIEELTKQSECPIYLDIDLDYFVKQNSSGILGAGELILNEEIRNLLSLQNPLMRTLLQNLVGLTIALEPEYCGGINNSLQALKILNEEFFGNTLFTDKCMWNI